MRRERKRRPRAVLKLLQIRRTRAYGRYEAVLIRADGSRITALGLTPQAAEYRVRLRAEKEKKR
jgi:hypothetical protein